MRAGDVLGVNSFAAKFLISATRKHLIRIRLCSFFLIALKFDLIELNRDTIGI